MKTRETIWFFSSLILASILAVIFSGNEGAIDINIHDTYYVIANEYFWFWLFVFVFFLSYLIKCLVFGFSSRPGNLLLLFSTGLFLLTLIPVSQFLFLGTGSNDTLNKSISNEFWKNVNRIFLVTYGLVLVFFGLVAFKTGQNWRKT